MYKMKHVYKYIYIYTYIHGISIFYTIYIYILIWFNHMYMYIHIRCDIFANEHHKHRLLLQGSSGCRKPFSFHLSTSGNAAMFFLETGWLPAKWYVKWMKITSVTTKKGGLYAWKCWRKIIFRSTEHQAFHDAQQNHHVQWKNPLFLWPCSIAMLVITRGRIP